MELNIVQQRIYTYYTLENGPLSFIGGRKMHAPEGIQRTNTALILTPTVRALIIRQHRRYQGFRHLAAKEFSQTNFANWSHTPLAETWASFIPHRASSAAYHKRMLLLWMNGGRYKTPSLNGTSQRSQTHTPMNYFEECLQLPALVNRN